MPISLRNACIVSMFAAAVGTACSTSSPSSSSSSSSIASTSSSSRLDGSPMDSAAVDAPDDVIQDSSACPSGEYLVYVAPGCGNDAHAVCRGPGDACIVTVCNCDGTQGVRCDQSVKPYLHDGPCADADASDADLSDALPSDASHGDAGTDDAIGDAAADGD